MGRNLSHRDTSLDLIKLIAIAMVIVLHVSSTSFSSTDSGIWYAVNFYESFTRVSVPLFFMVTGSLLVTSPYDLKTIKERVFRVSIPLVFWSVIYMVFFHFLNGSEFSFVSLINKPAAGHLWYLYTLICVYLTMPIICCIYQTGNIAIRALLILFWFAECIIIPSMKSWGINISPYFDLTTIGLYQGYFLIGAVLSNMPKTRKTRIFAMIIFMIMSSTILILTKLLFDRNGLHDVRYYLNSSIFVSLASISLFYSLHRLPINNRLITGFISSQSKYIFGVYLIHFIFIYLIAKSGIEISNKNVYLSIPVVSIIIYLISFFICAILKKTKIRNLIS